MLDLCCVLDLIQLGVTLIAFLFILLCVLVKLTTPPYPNILEFDQEKYFKTSLSGCETKDFPSLTDGALDASIVHEADASIS